MHPCLHVHEIASAICSDLYTKDLLAFALTNTRFKEPGLSALWRNLDSILPLLKLFPQDTWDISDRDEFQADAVDTEQGIILRPGFTFRRQICTSDWLRASSYTPYVREFSLDLDYESVYISVETLNSAATAFNGTHVFPNLRKLRLVLHQGVYNSFAKLLFPPSLVDIDLLVNDSKHITAIISQLGVTCPNMAQFVCNWTGNKRADLSALVGCLSRAVSSWTKLRYLAVPLLRTETMEYIAQLPHLEGLELRSPTGLSPSDLIFFAGFDSLRELAITGRPLLHLIQTIDGLRTRTLSCIEVELPEPDGQTADQWEGYFNTVARCSHEATELSLLVKRASHSPLPPFNSGFIVRPDALRPLLRARNLKDIDLPNCYYFALDDSFIEELAKASPNLKALNIGTERTTGRTPTLTLDSWLHIFKHCPELISLGLVVDTSNARIYLEKKPGEGEIKPRGEFYLFVGDSEVESPAEVAAFLSAFLDYPLEGLDVAEGAEEQITHAWEEVDDLLAVFIKVRQQEKEVRPVL